MTYRILTRLVIGLLACFILSCANNSQRDRQGASGTSDTNHSSQSRQQTPTPGSVRIKQPPIGEDGKPQPTYVDKTMYTVVAAPGSLSVNGVAMADMAALKTFLDAQTKPVLMLSAHRCLSSELATELMTLLQAHTDTPIPYKSHGTVADPVCE